MRNAANCLVAVTKCTAEDTIQAITESLSVLYSYNFLIDRPMFEDINYSNVRQAFACDQSKCKGVINVTVIWMQVSLGGSGIYDAYRIWYKVV